MTDVRVRFAPSPTGDLHVGGARAALFNWLYARAKGGTYILRIEDTDKARSTDESVRTVLDGLAWLGLDADEGPFSQSDREDLYRTKVDELLASGGAYRCYCTRERLDALREHAQREKLDYHYDRHCRDLTEPPSPDAPFTVRAKLPNEGELAIDDIVKGRVVVRNDRFDDFIIARTSGVPTYNFVVVVDDLDMRISHVIRGDDHLNNTPKQIHLYRLFGAEPPRFAHLPMVHGPDGKKLSKRHGAASVLAFRDLGFFPETMISYLARLGWSHGDQEEFTVEELARLFDIEDCQKSAAVFDQQKLEWQSGRRIRALAPRELLEHARPYLEARGLTADEPWLPRAVVAVQERAKTLAEVADALAPFFARGEVEFEEKAARKFITEESTGTLRALADKLEALDGWTSPALEEATQAFLAENELKMKHVGQPSRVALTGGTVSPPIFDCMEIYGRDLTLARLRGATPPPPAE